MKRIIQFFGTLAGLFLLGFMIAQITILLSCATKQDKARFEFIQKNMLYNQPLYDKSYEEVME